MTRPRVLVLTFTDIVRDPRVSRHIAALASSFDVVTCGKGPAPVGVVSHVELPQEAGHLPLTPLGLAAAAVGDHRTAYSQIGAATAASRMLRQVHFDVVLANDAVTVPVALAVAAGRPVMADLHEYAPREMEEDWRWRLMMQRLATAVCRQFLPRCAAVTTVAPGIAAEYEREFGVAVEVVTNAGPPSSPPDHLVETPIRLVHSGNANPNRGLEVMMDAAAGLPGVTLDLYLVPAPRSGGYLKGLGRRADATPNVRVLDPVPMSDVVTTLERYDVGVYVLAPTSFNNLHALPNKFFDFVRAGLGIVVGPSPEMAGLVRAYRLGEVTSGFGAAELRATLSTMSPSIAASWRSATRAAIPVLSSDEQAERLRTVVAGVLASSETGCR